MTLRTWLAGRPTEIRLWMREGAWLLLFIGSLLLAIGILWIAKVYGGPRKVDDYIRWLAFAYEFFGVFFVVWGINSARKAFAQPSIFAGLRAWLKDGRYLMISRPAKPALVNVPAATISITGFVPRVIAHGTSIEDQVEWLKREVEKIYDRADSVEANLIKRESLLRSEIKAETVARSSADERLMKLVEESAIGDFGLELLGASFLIVGLALSNLAPEFARLAHWAWAV